MGGGTFKARFTPVAPGPGRTPLTSASSAGPGQGSRGGHRPGSRTPGSASRLLPALPRTPAVPLAAGFRPGSRVGQRAEKGMRVTLQGVAGCGFRTLPLLLATLPGPALPHAPSRSGSSRSSWPLPRPHCHVPNLRRGSADPNLGPPPPHPGLTRPWGQVWDMKTFLIQQFNGGTTGFTLEATSLSLPL